MIMMLTEGIPLEKARCWHICLSKNGLRTAKSQWFPYDSDVSWYETDPGGFPRPAMAIVGWLVGQTHMANWVSRS